MTNFVKVNDMAKTVVAAIRVIGAAAIIGVVYNEVTKAED